PEPFFPMRCRDGAIRLLAKEHIIEAELLEPPAEDDARPLGAREAMVAITLTNGRRFTACLFYQVPSARPRILDYLNGLTQRFVLVQSEESWRLVNWRHLDSIRPLD
ncbi:MAG TPA: hypothetical protein VFX39_07390, partial [Gemmatimonadaceae bacterium]|nr:hypothetical protein [Gemmatimonadaceae bacterium]